MSNQVALVRKEIAKQLPTFEALLPPGDKKELMATLGGSCMSAMQRNPAISRCEPNTVANALLQSAEIGLPPDGYHAHLIPYGKTCQFIIDYKGLVQLAYQCPDVKRVEAHVVYGGDHFEDIRGSEPRLTHIPAKNGDRGEDRVAVWAGAHMTNGDFHWVALSPSDVEKHKNRSRGADGTNSPWHTDTDAMWRKSAMRELSKWLPRANRLQRAMQAEVDHEVKASASPATMPGTNKSDPLPLQGAQEMAASDPEDEPPDVPSESDATPPDEAEAPSPEAAFEKLRPLVGWNDVSDADLMSLCKDNDGDEAAIRTSLQENWGVQL